MIRLLPRWFRRFVVYLIDERLKMLEEKPDA